MRIRSVKECIQLLLFKHENWCLDPQHPLKKSSRCRGLHITQNLGGGGGIPSANFKLDYPTSLASGRARNPALVKQSNRGRYLKPTSSFHIHLNTYQHKRVYTCEHRHNAHTHTKTQQRCQIKYMEEGWLCIEIFCANFQFKRRGKCTMTLTGQML